MNDGWERELLDPAIPIAWFTPRFRAARSGDNPIHRVAAQRLPEKLMPEDQTFPR